jgi:hypothetical protein
VRPLIGSLDSGVPDLAGEHRAYILESLQRALQQRLTGRKPTHPRDGFKRLNDIGREKRTTC